MYRYRPEKHLHHSRCDAGRRTGRGVVEWIVVAILIFVLIMIALPALQSMRELSRRSNCEQNLVKLGLALTSYESRFEHFPIGTINPQGPILNLPEGFHHNWIEGLLPPLGQHVIYERIDRSASVYASTNELVRQTRLPFLICPSAGNVLHYTTCYAGIHDSVETPIDASNRGMFILNEILRVRDIVDGLDYTIAAGEKVSAPANDLGWLSGTRSSLRNTGHMINAAVPDTRARADSDAPDDPLYVGGLGSDHPGGAYLLLASGAYEFKTDETDLSLLQQLAQRSDASTDELPLEQPLDTAAD